MSEARGEWLNGRWAAAIAGALANGGVRHVVVCPGSRSTPLALAVAASPRLKCWPVTDERSAAFFALGLAKGGDCPAAVLCTSGSAGAHFLPAVIEAAHGGTPLIVLTADRPWELQDFGAPQTTDQSRFFESFARVELLPRPDAQSIEHLRAVVGRALSGGGPVHFNVPFREPLAPGPGEPVPVDSTPAQKIVQPSDTPVLDEVRAALHGVERGLIVCGPREADDGFGEAVHALGSALGFPVLAEACSNARFGFPAAICHADLLLRHDPFAASHRPQVVLRFGGGLTAKIPQAWLDSSGARIFVFSERGEIVDPQHRAQAVIVGDPVCACRALLPAVAASTGYREAFLRADAIAGRAISSEALEEPSIARSVAAGASANLFLSSSMPVRDVDAFAVAGTRRLRVFANRGVNGIDGVTSTAAGVAAATGKPTVLLTGDLALIHDLHGMLIARQHGIPLTVVAVNNDGGGIFSFLPIAERAEHFETLFGTPHGLDLAHLAGLSGACLERPTTLGALEAAIDRAGFSLIEVRTARAQNVLAHRALHARVGAALAEEGPWR
ncbi:MAG: 2-succinyl-5-enolpyruvyl-6-hydroxy-3-cyclohexene-carboxylic-acid synthase [Myxococcaceae bacterium]|nr:2-succinyl-5-enolpyruvyl-6-hydroxy-3-cyclohexene-carboxylic-acid synthase [Myxococcaceae bacterium]